MSLGLDLEYSNNVIKIVKAITSTNLLCPGIVGSDYCNFMATRYVLQDGTLVSTLSFKEDYGTLMFNRTFVNNNILEVQYCNADKLSISIPSTENISARLEPITDELYFQYSLMYNDEQLKMLVLCSTINFAPRIMDLTYFSLNLSLVDYLLPYVKEI